jgi:competence protein ComEC
MPSIAAIPALGLLAGAVLGLLLPDLPLTLGVLALALAALAAAWAWRRSRPLVLTFAIGLAFLAGGTTLAVHAWQIAWRPSLRVAFEELARSEREEARRAGRALPEDDSAMAILTGVVRADASPRAGGVSLSLAVTAVRRPGPFGPGEAGSVRRPGPFRLRSTDDEDELRRDAPKRESATAVGPGEDGTDIRVRGGVLLTVGGVLALDRADEWRAGRTVRVAALLRRPSRYLDPGVPDEARALARRGTVLVGSVKSGALVEVVARGSVLAEAAATVRHFARTAIRSSVGRWSARSAAIVIAVIIGDRAGLDDSVEERLQEAGTYHVIAISGGNIAILTGLALIGFRLAGWLGRVAMLSAMASLLAYGYLVTGGASVNRATLMAVVYFAARALDLRGGPLNVLALAAGLLVAAQPLAVVEPGFLLTFAATVAIVVAVPVLAHDGWPRFIRPIVAMFAGSAAAEAALLPLSAFIFSRVTVAGLLLNFAAIPLMAIVQIAGLAVLPAASMSAALGRATGWVAHIAAEGLVRSADLVAVVPILSWRVARPGWAVFAIYYIGLIGAWILWRSGLAWLGSAGHSVRSALQYSMFATAVGAGFWIAAEPWLPRVASRANQLQVTFIDVGQGDAALVRFPGGRTLLVDAGGVPGGSGFDLGERVVAPVLRHAGIHRLDSLVVSHGDIDHAGGAAAIVREFRPLDVWEGIPVPPLPLLQHLRKTAAAIGARWAEVQTGDVLYHGDVQIAVRHPSRPDWERQDVRNDDSIVLEILWRDASIVLTGDIGWEAEREIAPLFPPSALRVVKVPHHGSRSSSSRDFVRALAPRLAVVSVGRANTFGHPAPAVLEVYRDAGAHLFRTDQDGAITVETDGYSLEVRTFTGQRLFIRPRNHENTKPDHS